MHTNADLIESTASSHGQARITMVTSEAYKFAAPLDKSALTTLVPDDQTSILQLKDSFQRYCNAKLGVLHFALELDKRLKERGVEGVLTNACHPGEILSSFISPIIHPPVKFVESSCCKLIAWSCLCQYSLKI
jgi:NAD(P)-dependent dehydrogenase (short-subunit alcohol dehydrogenase family)